MNIFYSIVGTLSASLPTLRVPVFIEYFIMNVIHRSESAEAGRARVIRSDENKRKCQTGRHRPPAIWNSASEVVTVLLLVHLKLHVRKSVNMITPVIEATSDRLLIYGSNGT